MDENFQRAIERLEGLVSIVRNQGLTDFNSGSYDLKFALENQSITVVQLMQDRNLSIEELQVVKRLLIEAQFLILY